MIANALSGAVRAGVLALACFTLASPVLAQRASQSALTLAKQIIVAKGANKIYEPVIVEVIDRSKQMVLQTNPTLTRDMNDVSGKLVVEFTPKITEVLNEVARLYAARFTEAELKEVLAFYSSPIGKKIVAEEPLILDQTVAFTEQWASKLSEEVLARFRAEMRKKGHNL